MSLTHFISLDAETNGLGGQAFAVAMTLNTPDGEAAHVVLRCPIEGRPDTFVASHVLPAIVDLEINCESYAEMLAELRYQWHRWIDGYSDITFVAHVAWPVEARLLLDMFPGEAVWKGPYPLIDVAAVLYAHGHNPTSVDEYLKAHGVPAPEGSPHNPLYDARAAMLCLRHLGAERRLTHSEETLRKVYDALTRAGLAEQQSVDAINDMQNNGLYFREVRADG